MNITLFNQSIPSISMSNLLGIYIGSRIQSIEPLPLMMYTGNNYKILERKDLIIPKDYIEIETFYSDKEDNKNLSNYIRTRFPNLYTILQNYTIVIIGTVFKNSGNKSNIIVGTNDLEILEGITLFYNALNIYPNNFIVLKKNGSSVNKYYLPIKLKLNYDEFVKDYIAPNIITVRMNNNDYKYEGNGNGITKSELFQIFNNNNINIINVGVNGIYEAN